MIKHYILDENYNVKVVDLETWAMWFNDPEKRIVARDIVDRYEVSTVFLGLDYRFGKGPPLLFETMVFRLIAKTEDRGADVHMNRHCTWDEAEKYHKKIVDYIDAGIFKEDYFSQEVHDDMKEHWKILRTKRNGTQ